MNNLIRLVIDKETEKPGCVLLQAAYRCSSEIVSTYFDAKDWITFPTGSMIIVNGTLQQWVQYAEFLRLRRSKFTILGNHPIRPYVTKFHLTYTQATELRKTLSSLGYEIEAKIEKPDDL